MLKFAPLHRIGEARRYVRLTPFDTATATGRSAERYRRAALSAIADAGSKSCGMALIFLSVNLTISYLGPERFGVWATIASLTAVLSFLDLGMGNALINRIAAADASHDPGELARAASGGLAALAVVGALLAALLASLAAWLPWGEVLSVSTPALAEEARTAAMVFGVLFGCNIVATGVRSIFIGLQRAFEAHLAAALGYVAAMVALAIVADAKAGIPLLLLATFGMQVLAVLILTILAGSRGIVTWISVRAARVEAAGLMRVGGLFLFLQIGAMVGWGADSLIIAHVMGPAWVAEFNVGQRLFQLVALPLALLSAPLWSAYADARARDDRDFVGRTLNHSLRAVAGLGIVGALMIAVISGPVVARWTDNAVVVSPALVTMLAIWTVTQGIGAAFGVFLNGTGIIRPQVVAVGAFIAVGLPLKWYLLENFGLAAFVAGSIGAYLVTHLAVYGVIFCARLMGGSNAQQAGAEWYVSVEPNTTGVDQTPGSR